ncbi:hypothetical protein D3C84_1081320 [compost metagenome]
MLLHADTGGHRPGHVHAMNALFARPGHGQVELAEGQHADDGAPHPCGQQALFEGRTADGIHHDIEALACGVLLKVLGNLHRAVVDGHIGAILA